MGHPSLLSYLLPKRQDINPINSDFESYTESGYTFFITRVSVVTVSDLKFCNPPVMPIVLLWSAVCKHDDLSDYIQINVCVIQLYLL